MTFCRMHMAALLPLLFVAAALGQQPKWITVPALRQVSTGIGTITADIDSRLPATRNQYTFGSDVYRHAQTAIWAHEAAHGVNSRIRNQYGDGTGTDNGFYVLHGVGTIIKEPTPLRFTTIGRQCPRALRGRIYQLYMVEQARVWDKQPLNIVDEWTAYVNGSFQTLENIHKGRGAGDGKYDALMSLETGVYTLVVARAIAMGLHDGTLTYDDNQFRYYVAWHWWRTRKLVERAERAPTAMGGNPKGYIRTFQRSRDPAVANLRDWTQVYFGKEWCRAILGI